MMTAFSLVSWLPFTRGELEMNRRKALSRASLMAVTDGGANCK